jgi:anthranilate synthase/aminodeoxychorismate synthase-like glutamine amidotransferase
VRLLMIDNYDSFTYNLVQYLGELGAEMDVLRNDAALLEEMVERDAAGVVISPGPGRPEAAGVSIAAVKAFALRGTPVLGVCLGHQAIGEAFGGRIAEARTLMHGKTSPIHHDQSGVFEGLPTPLDATRYHSLVVDPDSCPETLEVSARSPDGEIMGLRHRELLVEGVQFHPESILTPEGKRLLANFLSRCGKERGT